MKGNLLTTLGRPIFVLLNAAGVGLLFISGALPGLWAVGSATAGSAFLTIGITLPVGLYFQMQSNAEAFKILNSCSRAGIESVFMSRKHDAVDLRAAITDAVSKSATLSLLGIAFRTFCDPSGESREGIVGSINAPTTRLRMLVLDPDCDAARRRKAVEFGNATIDDIKYTLHNNLVAIAVERLKQLRREHARTAGRAGAGQNAADVAANWSQGLNMEVRLYDTEPVVFAMICDNSLFSEQYHRGRPGELVPVGSCIGKYMPVIQYRRGSPGFRFLECHFETVWKEAKDYTDTIVQEAISQESNLEAQSVSVHGKAT